MTPIKGIDSWSGETIIGRKISFRCLSLPERRTFFLALLASMLKEPSLGGEVTEISGRLEESGVKFRVFHVPQGIWSHGWSPHCLAAQCATQATEQKWWQDVSRWMGLPQVLRVPFSPWVMGVNAHFSWVQVDYC